VLDRRLPRALRELLLDPQAELDATSVTQPVLVAFSLALTAQWRAWGVAPDWVAGHSLGEFSAAQAAGCCALDALLELVAERGRLMQDLPAGAMAAVFAPPARVAALLADLGGAAWVAADNGPDDAVIAGPPAAVARALRLAVVEGLEVRPLPVAFAAHGPAVATSLDGLAAASARVAWRAPRCGWVSTRTGASQVAPPDAAHWRGHTRDPVRFGAALTALRAQRVEFMLELGPGASLARLAGRALPEVGVASSVAGDDDPAEHVLGVATRLWDLGVPIAWEQLHADVSL
ncbi:MAG: acyltransferase domain-containing protein, partial [Planctomycetes bacterium]|nr:acyltransferase domain-containing protein [Planctomycetota bacterium]